MIYSQKELKKIDHEIHQASMLGDTSSWQYVHNKYSKIPVTIEMPLGELTNPNIKGFLWGANMRDNVKNRPFLKRRRKCNAQIIFIPQ